MGLILSKLSGARGYLNYGRGIDSDAQAFLTAASITNIVQQKAVNDLVIALKGYSIWTKMKALYPVVGGTAARHAVNLKTPGTYNLTFTGGWIHASTGMTPNGTSDYANTGLTPSSVLTLDSMHLGYYSRTNVSAVQNEMGCWDGAGIHYTLLGIRRSDLSNRTYTIIQNTNASSYPSFIDTDSLGFYTATRTSSTLSTIYKNGTNRGTNGLTSSGNPSTRTIWLGVANGNTLNYSSKQCAFASIGDGLTDTEAANFYTAVQAFQTTLGRQV
jgi:hypothetical protein